MSRGNPTSKAVYANVTIGASAAVIKAGATGRSSVVVQNNHASNDLYVGSDSSVTTSNGLHLAAGQTISFNDYVGDVWGIASASGTDVRFFAVGA